MYSKTRSVEDRVIDAIVLFSQTNDGPFTRDDLRVAIGRGGEKEVISGEIIDGTDLLIHNGTGFIFTVEYNDAGTIDGYLALFKMDKVRGVYDYMNGDDCSVADDIGFVSHRRLSDCESKYSSHDEYEKYRKDLDGLLRDLREVTKNIP